MKKISIQPRGKYILVQQEEEPSRVLDSGLVIPSNMEQEKKAFGSVISMGPEIKDVKKGDRVIFGLFAGEHIQMREKGKEVEYILLHDEDVIAFLLD